MTYEDWLFVQSIDLMPEPPSLSELGITPEEFGEMTVCEVDDLYEAVTPAEHRSRAGYVRFVESLTEEMESALWY